MITTGSLLATLSSRKIYLACVTLDPQFARRFTEFSGDSVVVTDAFSESGYPEIR